MPRRKYAKGTKQNPIRIRTSKAEKRMYKAAARKRSYRPKGGITGVTTYQKDVKTAYRYKRAPTRVRRRAKRSYRSWISNMLKSEGSRKFHYNGDQIWTTGQNQQAFFGWMNYGANGTGGFDGSGDLGDIFTRMDNELRTNGTTSDNTQGGGLSRRYYLDNMKARAILTNTGAGPIFFEIYECYARKDIPLSEATTLQLFLNQMANGAFQATLVNSAGQAGVPNPSKQTSGVGLPNKNSAGVTPFQFRHFCQNWKITKSTRFQCAPGNSISFDCGSPKNITVNWDDYQLLMAKRGVTKLTLVRQWGNVENIGGTAQNVASSCAVEVSKDYNVKLLDTKLPESNYMTYTNQAPA